MTARTGWAAASRATAFTRSTPTDYAFHVFFDTPEAKAACEKEIEHHFDIVDLSKIPTRRHPRITDEPDDLALLRHPAAHQAHLQPA